MPRLITRLKIAWPMPGWVLVAVMATGCRRSPGPVPIATVVGLTVYSGEGLTGKRYAESEIAAMDAYECDPNEVAALFATATHKDHNPIWKGSRLGVATLGDGRHVRIAISYYGGFFAVLGERGIYNFDEPMRDRWDELVRTAFAETGPGRHSKTD